MFLNSLYSNSKLIRLWKHLDYKDKNRLVILVLLISLSGFLEVLTLGSIVPFLLAIINSSEILDNVKYESLLNFFNISSEKDLILYSSFLLSICIILSALCRLIITKLNFRWCYELVAEMSIKAFKKTLHQPFLIHSYRNSSSIISGITLKSSYLLNALVLPVMTIIQISFLVISVIFSLFFLLPFSNMAILSVFAFGYILFSLFLRNILENNSKHIANLQTKGIMVLQESLSGIKEIILSDTFNHFISRFSNAERPYRKKLGDNAFISIFPRFFIEALGVVLIILIILLNISNSSNPSEILPSIGVLAVAAQRLLPYLQQLYASYSSIKAGDHIISDALDLLDQDFNETKISTAAEINFKKSIKMKNVSFRYPASKEDVLNNLNIEIKKNSIVGIIGTTGSGKTTFVDILMGLISPTSGELLIDDIPLNSENKKSWYKKILHVPQDIFISDKSIAENIAFGEDSKNINTTNLEVASKDAYIDDFVNSLPDKFEARTGEHGSNLSGGQKQRIGIARSLYRGGEILILDEATNALDMNTEKVIIDKIISNRRDLTTIIIAHNLETIKNCDLVIIIEKGEISVSGPYEEIKETSNFANISGKLAN